LGIYDMSGNLREWCSDYCGGTFYRGEYQEYDYHRGMTYGSILSNPVGPDSPYIYDTRRKYRTTSSGLFNLRKEEELISSIEVEGRVVRGGNYSSVVSDCSVLKGYWNYDKDSDAQTGFRIVCVR